MMLYARSMLNGLGADIIVIYCFVLVASHSYQLVDRFLPCYTVPQYFATPEDNLEMLADQTIPSWFVPQDREVIRQYFEGADGPYSLRP